MKSLLIVSLLVALSSLNAFASDGDSPFVRKEQVSTEQSAEADLVQLFNSEAKKPGSKIAKYLNALKKKENESGNSVDDEIYEGQVFRISSGRSGGSFGINYLIMIQSGYKSYSNPAGFLNASVTLYGEGEPGSKEVLRIEGPAKVSIDGDSY